jgi:hypothetical protein
MPWSLGAICPRKIGTTAPQSKKAIEGVLSDMVFELQSETAERSLCGRFTFNMTWAEMGASIAAGPATSRLLSTVENVSVFLKAPQVRLEQVKRSFGIPRIDARSPQTDYAAFLLLYDAPPLGDEFLGAAKIAVGIHLSK